MSYVSISDQQSDDAIASGQSGPASIVSAKVFAGTNANALAVRLTDQNGDYVDASGGSEGGGLTDAELRANAVPVSAATLPLPSGATTEATLALIKAKTDNLDVALSTRAITGLTDVQLRASAVPVSIAAATDVSDRAARLLGHVVIDAGTATMGKSDQGAPGTHANRWMVGLSDGASAFISPALEHATAASPASHRLSDGSAFYDAVKTGQLPSALVGGRVDANNGAWLGSTAPTVGSKTSANSVPVVVASDQGAIAVTPPTLTKGTQGATGFSTQDLKDAGRVLKTYTVSALATVTSEALISLTPYADLSAAGAATTFAVTSGKRLRIQQITVTVRCTSTVNVGGIVRLRLLAGTVLVGSPVHGSIGCQGSNLATAVAGNAQSFAIHFPDGLELSGTMQFGLTQLFSATSATIDVHVTGYEY